MTAIKTYTVPCWTLVQPDGRNVSEFEPHFDTEQQALDAAKTYTDDGITPTPKRLDQICSTATAACGYEYDEGGEGVEHWADADQLRDHLLVLDYRPGPDGSLRCPADMDCDECNGLPDAPDPRPMPGQIALLGEEATS